MIIMSKVSGAVRRYRALEAIFKPFIMKIEDKSERVAVAASLSYFKLFAEDVNEYVDMVKSYLEEPNDETKQQLQLATDMFLSSAIVETSDAKR